VFCVLTAFAGTAHLTAGDSPPRTRSAEWEASLAAVPELSLWSRDDTRDHFRNRRDAEIHPLFALLDTRDDLRGLPFLRGADCLGPELIGRVSRELRGQLARVSDSLREDPPRTVEFFASARELAVFAKDRPSLIWQMCECEPTPMRRVALDTLRKLDGPKMTETLVRAALFDPDADLRRVAATALLGRPSQLYRPLLLSGFSHPWALAADHAADALQLLNDRAAVPALVRVLEAGDPSAPTPDAGGTPVVRELVRINHARNCQLCHAPSSNATDAARAKVPSPNQPLPPSFSLAYYESKSSEEIVRTDVTYLRQDFSRLLPVLNPGQWPAKQRYDFFVRARPAAAGEITLTKRAKTPQRAAVLRALRALTGLTAGDRVETWKWYVWLNYRQRL
jgi:hypothetical protein